MACVGHYSLVWGRALRSNVNSPQETGKRSRGSSLAWWCGMSRRGRDDLGQPDPLTSHKTSAPGLYMQSLYPRLDYARMGLDTRISTARPAMQMRSPQDAIRETLSSGRASQEAALIPYGTHSGTRRMVMPSVMDTPHRVEYVTTHDLTIETRERPQPRRVRPGFWRTLTHKITGYLTSTPREQHVASCSVRRPFEAPMDRACAGVSIPLGLCPCAHLMCSTDRSTRWVAKPITSSASTLRCASGCHAWYAQGCRCPSSYADGARQGARGATQIADRFHLLQNLVEVLE